MTKVSTVVQRCRRRLYAQGRGRYNFLAQPLATTDTLMYLSDELQEIPTGVPLGVDSEIVLTRPPIDKTAKTVTVARGFMGTSAAAHVNTSMVEINPRFPVADIVDTIVEEISSWAPRLFAVQQGTLGATRGTRAYDIIGASDLFLFGLQLEEDPSSVFGTNTGARSHKAYRVVRDQLTTNFASGFGLQLEKEPSTAVNLRFTWAEAFDTSSVNLNTDLENQLGLRASMIDLLVYGVCWRLMSTREIARTDIHASGETRRAEEVPAGFSAQTARQLLSIRDRRLTDEANNLRALYPYQVH